jgi:hypothetical protein
LAHSSANGYIYVAGGNLTGGSAQSTIYYTSTSRLLVGGGLDLVGLSGENLNEGGSGGSLTAGNTQIVGSLDVQGSARFSQNVSIDRTLVVSSDTLVKTATNTTTAFQVQNSGGAQLLNVDTTNPVSDLTTNSAANLVTNGSIEDGNSTTGWTARGSSTLSQSTTQKYVGNNSLSVVTTAAANDGAKYALTTTTLATNTQYTLTLSAKLGGTTSTPNNSISTIQIGRAEDGSTDTSCLTAQTINTAGWTTLTCTFTTGTTSSTPYIYIKQTDATARTFFVDGVQLTRSWILQNYSIESAIAGNWTTLGTPTSAPAQDATQAFIGTKSLKFTTSTTAGDGTKQAITLNDSTAYSISFYAQGSGTALTTMEAGYSSDGTTSGNTACITAQTVSNTSGAWLGFNCTFTTPSTHSGTPYIYIKNTAGTARTVFLDNIQLTTGNVFTAYREGTISLNGVVVSPTTFQNQTNSTTAFQIQNAGGSQLFGIDTINNVVALSGGNSGELSPWLTNSNALPATRDNAGAFAANGFIYDVGGDGFNDIVYNKINANGSIGTGAWTTNTNTMPAIRSYAGVTYANGYVYVVGGSADGGTTGQTSVYYAKVNTDGSIGSFITSTNSLPAARIWGKAIVYNGYLYFIGGRDNTPTSQTTAYYAKLNADGSVGAFNSTSVLPVARAGFGISIANGYLYAVGGIDASGGYMYSSAYTRINADGTLGTWVTAPNLMPQPRNNTSSFVANGYIYAVGGTFNNDTTNTTAYASLNSDGSIGSWSTNSTTMPVPKETSALATANGYVYALGGWGGSGTSSVATVYYASTTRISVGGSLDLVGLSGENLSRR